jgi:hypothetical protein
MDGRMGDRITGRSSPGESAASQRERERERERESTQQQLDAAPEEQAALQEAAVQRPERPRRGNGRKACEMGQGFERSEQ